MKIKLLLASTLLLSAPVSVLLPGCGGGSSQNSQSFNSTFALSSAQNGLLLLNTNGTAATGTLVVTNTIPTATSTTSPTTTATATATATATTAATVRQTRAISLTIPPGNYPLTGTFSTPSFTLTGNIPSIGAFSIQGQIPTNGGNGNYTLRLNEDTASGSFNNVGITNTPTALPTNTSIGTPVATSTMFPTNTPLGTPAATSTPTATSPVPTATVAITPTNTPQNTPTPTATTSVGPTRTAAPTPTPTIIILP